MSPTSLPLRRLMAAGMPWRRSRLERLSFVLVDGARTTLHVATYDRAVYGPRIVALERPAPLARWCREQGVRNAVVGGFFLRPEYAPLGQLRIAGQPLPSVAFDPPWGDLRACLRVHGERLQIAPHNELADDTGGELLQAGPLLVRDGQSVIAGDDAEGFSAGARQFDSDITQGRYPRAAVGIDGERLISVACDGRTRGDAGMTLAELADALVSLGATDALNLDGGGSASLVHHGRLRNRPREEHGVDLLGGRPIVTAVVFEPR
jgi:Phosphodiester glycosidase